MKSDEVNKMMDQELERLDKAFRSLESQLAHAKADVRMWHQMYDDAMDDINRLREALNDIASWSEGEKVNPVFDEPGSAEIARQALTPKEKI